MVNKEEIDTEEVITQPSDPIEPTVKATIADDGYIVAKGDSLVSIAKQLKTDWHELARLNAIHEPYQISVGQKLKTS